jgi:hypothetical protein
MVLADKAEQGGRSTVPLRGLCTVNGPISFNPWSDVPDHCGRKGHLGEEIATLRLQPSSIHGLQYPFDPTTVNGWWHRA